MTLSDVRKALDATNTAYEELNRIPDSIAGRPATRVIFEAIEALEDLLTAQLKDLEAKARGGS